MAGVSCFRERTPGNQSRAIRAGQSEDDVAGVLRPSGDVSDYLASFGFTPEYHACMEAQSIPSGVGLAIAREILEMQGGRIWVKSTLGKG